MSYCGCLLRGPFQWGRIKGELRVMQRTKSDAEMCDLIDLFTSEIEETSAMAWAQGE